MAGHSHWAGIKHKKGAADKKRGKLFGKLSRAIIVAAQQGADPDVNLALRYAIDRARKASMPKDNIERAVQKGSGEGGGRQFIEITYEGYGPGGVSVMCDVLTDNRNRTASHIRKLFEVSGGKFGSVAHNFKRKGLFTVLADEVSEDALFEIALEAGADDVERIDDLYEVTCTPANFPAVSHALETAGIPTRVAEVAQCPMTTVDLDVADGRRVLKLLEALEDDDDVQGVTSNFNMPDEVLAEVGA